MLKLNFKNYLKLKNLKKKNFQNLEKWLKI